MALSYNEQGSDYYDFSSQGSRFVGTDGSSSSSETHNEKDGGQDEIKTGDNGTIDWTDVVDGGTVVGHDEFDNSNDDNNDYSDKDNGQSSSGGGGLLGAGMGNSGVADDIDDKTDDTDKSKTSDNETVTWTKVNAFGGTD